MEREELLKLIKKNYAILRPEQGLRIYGIQQQSLREFKTNTKTGAAFEVEPASKYRLLDEEIKPKNEYDGPADDQDE